MTRTRLRLAGFSVALAVLFGGGYVVGAQFPADDAPAHEMDHATHPDSTPAASPTVGSAVGSAAVSEMAP